MNKKHASPAVKETKNNSGTAAVSSSEYKKELLKYKTDDSRAVLVLDRITSMLYSDRQKEIRCILTAGLNSGVGATTIAVNLAETIASSGRTVILADANFDNPCVKSGVKSGLSNFMHGNASISDIILETNLKNLGFIAAGSAAGDCTQLLSSDHFKKGIEELKNLADFVLFDSPPIDRAAAAELLSLRTDGTVLVAGYKITTAQQVKTTTAQFEASGANVLGVILNRVPAKKQHKLFKRNNGGNL